MAYRSPYGREERSKADIQTMPVAERKRLAIDIIADGLIAFLGLKAEKSGDVRYIGKNESGPFLKPKKEPRS